MHLSGAFRFAANVSSSKPLRTAAGVALLALIAYGPAVQAQGCVAAHSCQQPMGELLGAGSSSGPSGPSWIHRLTVDVGYRVFSSNKYYLGENAINRPNANRVENHQNIWDIGLDFRLSHRWSLIADIPVYDGTRHQPYPPSGIYQVSGFGDVTIGAQTWIFRPPTESHSNIAFSMSLKIPTGVNNGKGTAVKAGNTITAVADQSMQPGDGGWGFVLATQAYKRAWLKTTAYMQGQWLFNPQDTNGVPTFRSQPGQQIMSVTDQYLFRSGLAHSVPKVLGLQLSFGVRQEGVPVRDAFGSSNGFRRPGYIFSIDPGLMYSRGNTSITVNGPWAMIRRREKSVPELAHGQNGDAFFADYTVIVGLSHSF
jgi:hypothetical protein